MNVMMYDSDDVTGAFNLLGLMDREGWKTIFLMVSRLKVRCLRKWVDIFHGDVWDR